MPERILTYFAVRGRAEPVRMLLAEAEVAYQDRQISLEQWPDLKPSQPFEQLPVYADGALIIPQSLAICRYLADEYGFAGRSPEEKIRCDVATEALQDARNQFMQVAWSGARFEATRKEYVTARLPKCLELLERHLSQNDSGRGFWVGAELTYVDLLARSVLNNSWALAPEVVEDHPVLMSYWERLDARPKIAAYLRDPKRPPTLTSPASAFGNTPETSGR